MASEVNERIKTYRKEKKLTQGELAKMIDLKTSTYSQMEREGNITVDMALKIAEVLGIDPNLIVYGKETKADGELEVSTVKPTGYILHTPGGVIETLYGTTTQPEDKKDENDLPFDLSNTEKSIIKIYHYLPKLQQKEVRMFIDEIRKRGS